MPIRKQTNYPIHSINGNLYEVIAEYKIDSVKDVSGLRQHLDCTNAFKRNPTQTYIFCREIQEPQWEEIN